ncbi:GumC family protein [Shewanella marina]|uniref:GumC family protein n=1 Tax=Shewanella marina TaxID=487319 RepID=UPI000470A7CF|nr:hypothetical protein [Shewanella marina]
MNNTANKSNFKQLINRFGSMRSMWRGSYLLTNILALIVIWLIAIVLIIMTPSNYISRWTLILPGVGSGTQISLDNLGQASSSTSSPYASSAIDPRENYKAIALSDRLLMSLAQQFKLGNQQTVAPNLKLPYQTGLMEFSLTASDPKQAQQIAQAHITQLQTILELLRQDEISQKEQGVQLSLKSFNDNLERTQQALIEFKTRKGLVSEAQFKEVTLNIEKLKLNKSNMQATLQGNNAKILMLEKQLKINSRQAADILSLKNDQLFRQLLVQYSELHTQSIQLSRKVGPKHPKMVNLSLDKQSIFEAMQHRCLILLGYNNDSLMLLISDNIQDHRAELMQQLLEFNTESQGLNAQLKSLDKEIEIRQNELNQDQQDSTELAELNRAHQLATTVLTSAIAKMDIGKADIYAAYPLLQVLAMPSTPNAPDKTPIYIIILAAIVASIIALIGCRLLWLRKK